MTWHARCPHCEGRDLAPLDPATEDVRLDAGDEEIRASHRCLNPKCGRAFRVTPPTRADAREVAA